MPYPLPGDVLQNAIQIELSRPDDRRRFAELFPDDRR
jgi:hypothetical protein